MKEMRDSIDFGKENISVLFRKLLIPTVLGMVFSAIFVITDGIFVGKGIGSDALAAVNITSPLYMITIAVGLMFGVGASVVASIHLSHGKARIAGINISQALVFSFLVIVLFSALCILYRTQLAVLLGSSPVLMAPVLEYMDHFVPFLPAFVLLHAGMFYVRVDGSPKYAMSCNIVAALLNMFLDYLFIFVFDWGLMGAAVATGIGTLAGLAMILVYLWKYSTHIQLYKIKLSRNSMLLMGRNIGYMIKLGTSAFMSEASIACMMFIGNYVFIEHLGKEGVAAFSIVCYIFPIIFMVYNAIAQSAQPIISYNFGIQNNKRVKRALRLSLQTALLCGFAFFLLSSLLRHPIVALFVDSSSPAYSLAVYGLPYFASGYVFFALNITGIGYYQGVERSTRATLITFLRGGVFLLGSFLLLPSLLGTKGIWLAVPMSELLTFLYIGVLYLKDRFLASRTN